MKRFFLSLAAVFLSLGFGLASPAAAKEQVVTVKVGDTLSKIAGKNWQAVCKANNLANCSRLRVGQKIRLGAVSAPQGARQAPTRRDADGWFHWRNVGGSPLTKCPDMEKCWAEAAEGVGLIDSDKAEIFAMIKEGRGESVVVENGTKYEYMSFYKNGHVRFEAQVILDSKTRVTAKRYRLSSGRVVDIIDNCGNWGVTSEIKLLRPPPPPVVEEAPPPPAPPEPEKEPACWDPKLVIGQEYEPEHSGGDRARSTFASGALYKCWRGKRGMHGVGAGFQASMWDGKVDRGKGDYEGHFIGIGPAYEYVSDEGWDIELKALGGVLLEKFEEGDYQSRRRFGMVGASVAYNNYERRLNGKRWFPETQGFGFMGTPISRDVEHSWQNNSIEDTRDLSRLGILAQAGIRQWIYDGKVVSPYVQLGTFVETPGNWTGSARIGIADAKRICGIGIGVDVDFLNGGEVFGLGWWCDIVRGVRYIRQGKRAKQIDSVTDGQSGDFIVPIGQNLVSTPSQE